MTKKTSRPSVVLILSDSQNKDMIGAYGLQQMSTPHLDRLCTEGTRFERAYCASPVCTPARGALFSGVHPPTNGATYNGATLHSHIPHAGHWFRRAGYRTAYTGKWHLDGDFPYIGSGEPDTGFEPDWWYDGQNYRQDVGEETFKKCYAGNPLERIDEMPEDPAGYWAHGVADRAVDFLERVSDDEPFFLCASFDEPHGPYCAPPSYYRGVDPDEFPIEPSFNNLGTGKPQMQMAAANFHGKAPEKDLRNYYRQFYGCNRFMDTEIGRILTAVQAKAPDNTIIVYTSDHGTCMAEYQLWTKAFWMYDRAANIPLVISGPGFRKNAVSEAPVSHVDILPTLLAAAGIDTTHPLYAKGDISIDCPEEEIEIKHPARQRLHGEDLGPILRGEAESVQDEVMLSFFRFGNLPREGHFGNLYPVRCLTDGRYKLVVNLFDTDEFYDLEADLHELENRLYVPATSEIRDHMHDRLLEKMEETLDPMRSHLWYQRPWRGERRLRFHQMV